MLQKFPKVNIDFASNNGDLVHMVCFTCYMCKLEIL
jgi:hypothetical protein